MALCGDADTDHFWSVCGHFCGMSGTGHRGDVKHHTRFCKEDRISSRSGDRDIGGGDGQADRERYLFYAADIFTIAI